MATTRGRVVYNNQPILDQADFFMSDGYTRVTGLSIVQVAVNLFYLNQPQPWVITNGLGVTDAQITAGKVYWNEIPGAPGYYNVRFIPNALGYWRLLITYPAGLQINAQDYDVIDTPPALDAGLKASFNKPGC